MPKNKPRILLIAAILILLALPLTGFFAGNVRPAPAITRNTGTPPPNCSDTPANPNCNIVGFTCAFGNVVANAAPTVITPIKTRDPTSPAANLGVADTKCNWAGDTDGDNAGAPPPAFFESGMDPLISDPTPKDTIAACGLTAPAPCGTPNGGGVIFDVMFFNSNRTFNGFETIISWDPAVLNMQSFDQAGLLFGGNVGCPITNPNCTLALVSTIDNNAGTARLAQNVESVVTGGAGTTVRLFRMRFNVVGAGSTNVIFTKSIITFAVGTVTGPLDHLDANMVFSTNKVFNVLNNAIPGTAACQTTAPPCGLGFNASYTFSPSPPLASGLVTFTATANCKNCTGTLSYFWDFSSLERHSYVLKNQATGPLVSIDPKVTSINRVTLYVKDQATRIHNVTATRGLPLDVFVSGPSTLAGNVGGNFNGYWLGGVANYTGNWVFCPLATSLGATPICNPVDSQPIGATPGTSSAIVGESWAFAGVYTTNVLTIMDGAGRSAASYPSPVSFTRNWMVNITTAAGVPPAFTVGATADTTSPPPGTAVKITATITYDASYDAAVQATNFIFEFVWGDGTANTIVPSTFTGSAAHVYTRSGTFTVKVKATENNPFTALSSVQENGFSPAITASGPPLLVDITGGPPGGTTTVGTPITFHAVPSGGRPPYSYSWTGTSATPPTGTMKDYTVTYAAPGSYTVSVTLTDADGKTATKTSPSFTVTAGGPTVDFTAAPPSPMVGQSVTFTATTTGGTAPFTFSWDFGDGTPKGTDAAPTHTYSMAGSFTVKVNATDYAGIVAKGSHPITVNAFPTADFSTNPASPTVGQSVMFSSTVTGGTVPFTFSWDFGDGTPKGSGASPSHTYTAAGTFTVNVNATDSANVVAKASHMITVSPAVDFSANPPSPTVSQSVAFTATTTGGTGPFTFSWDFGDSTAKGTDASPSHTYTAPGTYTVKVNATDHTGLVAKASHSITVTAVPGLCATAGACDFTFSPTAPAVGDTVTFTATVSGGSSPYTYAWDFGDGMTGTGVTITRSYASANTYTVKVTVTDSTTPTPQTKIIQHTVTVAAASVPFCSTAGSCDFTFTPTAPNVGDSVTFSATVSGGTSPYTYTWDFGDSATGSGSQASHTYTGAGSYTVKLTITDSTSPTPQSKIIQHTVTATTPVQVPPISQKIFGLDPIQFYGLVAVAILLGVLVGGLGLYSRRRRS